MHTLPQQVLKAPAVIACRGDARYPIAQIAALALKSPRRADDGYSGSRPGFPISFPR